MSIEINVHLRSRAQPPGDGDLSRYASSPGSRTVWRRPVGAELTVNLGDPASVVEAVRASNEHLPAAEMLDNPTRGPSPSGA